MTPTGQATSLDGRALRAQQGWGDEAHFTLSWEASSSSELGLA